MVYIHFIKIYRWIFVCQITYDEWFFFVYLWQQCLFLQIVWSQYNDQGRRQCSEFSLLNYLSLFQINAKLLPISSVKTQNSKKKKSYLTWLMHIHEKMLLSENFKTRWMDLTGGKIYLSKMNCSLIRRVDRIV